MKKLLSIVFISTMLFSCSTDNEVTDPNENEAVLDLETQVAQGKFDNSNLGIYEGVFTTLDGQSRATVLIEFNGKSEPEITFGFPNGNKVQVKSSTNASKAQSTGAATFSGKDFSLDFTVNEDGSNPLVSNVTYMGQKGDVLIAKETSKAAVIAKTGVYECTSDCSTHPELGEPGAIQTFNTVLTDSGDSSSDINIQFTLNNNSYSGTLAQSACQPGAFGDFTKCKLNGTVMANTGPVTINPNNNRNSYHRFRSDDRSGTCSDIVGVMTYKSSIFNEIPGAPEHYVMEFRTDNPVGEGGDCE